MRRQKQANTLLRLQQLLVSVSRPNSCVYQVKGKVCQEGSSMVQFQGPKLQFQGNAQT